MLANRAIPPGAAAETEFQLACIAIKHAAEDAGIPLADIDGSSPTRATATSPRGSRLKRSESTLPDSVRWPGWRAARVAAALAIADAAVTAGYANSVSASVSLAQGQFDASARRARAIALLGSRRSNAYGLASAAMWYGMVAKRWMHDHGVTEESLRKSR